VRGRLALALAKASGTDDVGEQHGHGRRLGHGACLPRAFSRMSVALVAPPRADDGRIVDGSDWLDNDVQTLKSLPIRVDRK
jgi:hypothetical protein